MQGLKAAKHVSIKSISPSLWQYQKDGCEFHYILMKYSSFVTRHLVVLHNI